MKKNYFKSLMQAAVLVCTPLVIASCDDVFGDTDNPIPAYMSIKQSDINLVLHADKKDQATATRTAIAATGAEVVYESTKPEVATVDAKTGVITAVGEGTCEIIAKVTGKDSNGRDTYQPQQASFSVSVKDYRCRVNLIEGVEIPAFNVADKDLAEIDLTKIVEAWPKNVTLTYTSDKPAIADMVGGKLKLMGGTGTAKVTAEIKAADVPAKFENKSFPKNQKTGEFEITVKDGVAYFAGYDAEGKEIRKTIFKDYNGEKYTNLSDVLKGSNDVTLDAGWYYVNDDLTSFSHNIRVKGDVNIILNNDFPLNLAKDLMDESAKQNYKLNFYSQRKTAKTPEKGSAKFNVIKEFKDVNICGANINASASAVENVTINNGSIRNLVGTGIGNVNITDGSAWNVGKFATLTLTKVDKNANPRVIDLNTIGTVTIPAGTQARDLNTVTTATVKGTVRHLDTIENLTVNKATIGNLKAIGTADITETEIFDVKTVTTLNLKKVTSNGYDWNDITVLNIDKDSKFGKTSTKKWNRIGTANINGAEVNTDEIIANALNINGGKVVAKNQIKGFKGSAKAGYTDADAKVTMTDGELTVGESLKGTAFAVLGDVEVTKGEFTAQSQDYHAVSGALVGTFYGSTDNATWTKITGEERPKFITTIEPKK